MAYYRLYLIDSYSGHIDQVRELEAEDDTAAISEVEATRGHCAMELWSRSRKVKEWEAAPRPHAQLNG